MTNEYSIDSTTLKQHIKVLQKNRLWKRGKMIMPI